MQSKSLQGTPTHFKVNPFYKIVILLFVFSSIAWCASNNDLQWKSTNMPSISTVTIKSLSHVGQFIYASVDYGELYRSSGNVVDWNFVGTMEHDAYAIESCGKEIIAGLGLPFSLAMSDNWGYYVSCYFGPPQWYGHSTSLMKSLDNGITWQRDSLPQFFAFTIDKDTVFAISGDSLCKRLAGTEKWKCIGHLTLSPDTSHVKIMVSLGGTYSLFRFGKTFIIVSPQGVFKSNSTLNSWACIANFSTRPIFDAIRCGDNLLVATQSSDCLMSSDTGKTWKASTVQLIQDAWQRNVLDCSNGICFAQTTAGIMQSLDTGKTWNSFSGAPDHATYFLNTGNSVLVGRKNLGIMKAGINSSLWNDASLGLHKYQVKSIGIVNDTIVTDTGHSYDISQSNWLTNTYNSRYAGQIISFSQGRGFSAGSFMMYGNDDAIFRSYDSGSSYVPCSDSLPKTYCYQLRVNYLFNTNHGILAKTGAITYRSLDSGTTWKKDSLPPGLLAAQGKAALYSLQNNDGVISSSQDNGFTWKSKTPQKAFVGQAHCFSIAGADFYVGTTKGVFISNDSGSTWKLLGQGLPNRSVKSLVITDKNVFAVLDSSEVYRLDFALRISNYGNFHNNNKSVLYVNYAGYQLRYVLTENQSLKIEMFAVNGSLVKTLFKGYVEKGSYRMSIAKSVYPNAIRLIRMTGSSWSKIIRIN